MIQSLKVNKTEVASTSWKFKNLSRIDVHIFFQNRKTWHRKSIYRCINIYIICL